MASSIMTTKAALSSATRVVIKVGSSLLTTPDGAVSDRFLTHLANDIAALKKEKKDVVLVSSGAVAIGKTRLGLSGSIHNLRIDQKQAAAAAGQAHLVHAYETLLAAHGLVAAQILITLGTTENRRSYLNARATLQALLSANAVPIINENDTVATSELRYGDNDRLAAHAAQMASADLLILLSDVDGLYDSNPKKSHLCTHIDTIHAITPDILALADATDPNGVGTGGMVTKLAAAQIATNAGCTTLIAAGSIAGNTTSPIAHLRQGGRASLFTARQTPYNARRQWIAGTLRTEGSITVDAGAANALKSGASLLPAGVCDLDGNFARGDAIRILDSEGQTFAKGITTYDASEVRLIKGYKSDAIMGILGYRRRPAIIHRDDLVLTDAKSPADE